MKLLTFDPDTTPAHARHFHLICTAINSPTYQFAGRDELRHHGKMLDALEAISVEGAGDQRLWRTLRPGPQQLVVDDAWLAILKKMATPPNTQWIAAVSRDAEALLEFLDSATEYTPAKS